MISLSGIWGGVGWGPLAFRGGLKGGFGGFEPPRVSLGGGLGWPADYTLFDIGSYAVLLMMLFCVFFSLDY